MVETPLTMLRRSAMDYLARREHSFHELQSKLEKKYPDFDKKDQILPALTRLKDQGLQSDQRFLEAYIRYRRNKGFGPLKIESELFHKGVDSSLLRGELYNDENDWQLLCRQAMEKRFKIITQESQKEMLKYQRFLSQRGFSSEDIRRAISNNAD